MAPDCIIENSDSDEIDFRAVGDEDYPLLRGWLESPHMREWWGEPETELGYIREMVEGRDTTRPFLILLNGRPIGYIQYWCIGDHQNDKWVEDHPWLLELPTESLGLDIFLGEMDFLGQGIGTEALSLMTERLIATGRGPLIIDPDSTNARAIRSYEKAGFRRIEALLGQTGDTLIMKFDPNSGINTDKNEYRI